MLQEEMPTTKSYPYSSSYTIQQSPYFEAG